MNNEIEIFVQGEGIEQIKLVNVPRSGTVRSILEAVWEQEYPRDKENQLVVLIEDEEDDLDLDQPLDKAGIRQRSRVHVHRCRRAEVRINFNASQHERKFPTSATVGRVKTWAVKVFSLDEVDAAEHVLQICGQTDRPDQDIHMGTLVRYPDCAICFDLVPIQRIEG